MTSSTAVDVEYENLQIEHRGPISWIVLDRPTKANALSTALLDEFSHALDRLTYEGGPVIGIRGRGRGFSAGYDIDQVGKVVAEPDPVADRERLARNMNRFLAIWDHPKPVIAAVHGYCIAGATQMCVFADLTFVADDAKIGEPAMPLGGGYIAPVWAPLVGPKRAKELAFVPGNTIDGTTAVEWGWANHAVPESELIAAVETFAARVARTPSDVLRIKKLSINRSMEAMGVRNAAQSGAEMDALLHLSPSVKQIRAWIADVGLKAAVAHYKRPVGPEELY
ncbi:enoyl-CoA hydratase-related protein [Antrihabitans stalactiti]|uniref:Enoyl-CoA hydratase/isomerase family protein n=1 Tax=Antrihabitans stalactiti TaxID=2584121 RepID=A0A848KLJ7_9NOCA|nr:enoyl-CoA hydratase-related protein [Antrihabitans stalactiti]NMN97522.1 enoyl-CoA hydratase/isomerase family protein [Antrihabitans stalactiti]